jgi:poly(ADP-ribose) glycohydrolase ARH3
MHSDSLRAKFLGALVGTGVGDAVGAGFEGRPPFDSQLVESAIERKQVLRYTDDTHMMIGIAESLIEKGGFDGAHMADVFAQNYEAEPWRGYGPGPPVLFRMLRRGVPWDQLGDKVYSGGSYGNGSAMRIAPVGVMYHDDLDSLREVAYKSSHITHSHELGKEGAALQACAIAMALGMRPDSRFDAGEFLSKLGDFVTHAVYKEKLAKAKKLLRTTDARLIVQELGHGVEAFNSAPTAIYCFVSRANSFRDAILFAVSLGGDTDTIAAMTGAISGAYLGVDDIPEKWRLKLENRAYIEELANKLYQLWLRKKGSPPS